MISFEIYGPTGRLVDSQAILSDGDEMLPLVLDHFDQDFESGYVCRVWNGCGESREPLCEWVK